MKLSKNLGRVATTLLATAMLASVSAVPAFADTGVSGTGKTEIPSISIYKTLYLPTGTDVPDVEYEFNIVGATATEDDKATGTQGVDPSKTNVTLEVKSGEGTYNDVGSYDFASYTGQPTVMEDNAGVSYVKVPVTLTFPDAMTFSDAGVYKYNITETIKENGAEVTDATDTEDHYVFGQQLTLYLYVNREGDAAPYTYQVVGAVVEDANGDKTDDIYNYYDVEPGEDGKDPSAKLGSLSIAKTVTGKMGDYEEDFQFTIQGIADGTYNIAYTGDNVDSTRDTTVTVSEGKATLSVQHGEKVTIYGIAPANNVTVSEDATTLATEGYTVTNTVVNGTAMDTASNTATVNVEASKEATTAFTNNRDAVSPTGIVMNVAPYVLLVVVAAAGCFVFLRKRRED